MIEKLIEYCTNEIYRVNEYISYLESSGYDESNLINKAIGEKECLANVLTKLKNIKEPTICGYSAEEVITILNGLELERKLDIKMTMDNLLLLFEKLREDFHNTLKVSYDRMGKLGVDTDE